MLQWHWVADMYESSGMLLEPVSRPMPDAAELMDRVGAPSRVPQAEVARQCCAVQMTVTGPEKIFGVLNCW